MLRNPFAIKNGKTIVIDDLSEQEKGLKCGCVCPSCGGEFEAKFGNVRTHHFSHSKGGCDEETAFLTGLYKLYKQYCDEYKHLLLPEIKLYCNLGNTENITEENYNDYIHCRKQSSDDYEYLFSESFRFNFEKTEIVFNGKNRPEALLLYKGAKKLAVVIQHPQIGCNPHFVNSLPDTSSVRLDLFYIEKNNLSTDSMYKDFSNISLYSWLSNNLIKSRLHEINMLNKHVYEERQKWKKKEKEARQKITEINNNFKKSDKINIQNANESKVKIEQKKREQIEKRKKQYIPLDEVMRRWNSEMGLGEPDTSDNGRLMFVQSFPGGKNELSGREGEVCWELGIDPIDHWGQVWLKCKKCGSLVKYVLKENEQLPQDFYTVCSNCK